MDKKWNSPLLDEKAISKVAIFLECDKEEEQNFEIFGFNNYAL